MRHTIFKLFKNLSFFATGAGVAVDLAATKASSSVATAGNLTAVAGGSAYSIFKNFETASDINEQRQYCSEVLADMHSWVGTDNTEELLRRLEITGEEVESLLARINAVNGNTRQSYIYAAINTVVQVTLGVISIGINAVASRRNNDDTWDSINVMNIFVIPILISSQYIIHSMFIARLLRKMDNQSTELRSELEKLKSSTSVQMWKLSKLASEIDNYHQQLKELNENIRQDDGKLAFIRSETKRIGSQPITVGIGMEEEVKTELTNLSKQWDELEQEITRQNKTKQQVIEQLQALINDTDKLIAGLRISFVQYQQFNDIYHHVQAIKPQLDQEVGGDSSLSPLGIS